MKLRVYGDMLSGNCYKVKLLMQWLGLEHEWRHVDVMAGETRTPEFARLNPNAKIPVLELADGTRLAESNAILNFLAEGTPFLPSDRLERARVLQWQFFEQYSHEPNIAVARFWLHVRDDVADMADELAERQRRGYQALDVMEGHLAGRDWFVGDAYSVADIALYAYTHVADEGGFDLARYPRVRGWLDRVASQPGHVLTTQSSFD